MATCARDRMLKLRISSTELDLFKRIAQARGVTLSELIRLCLVVEGTRNGVSASVPVT